MQTREMPPPSAGMGGEGQAGPSDDVATTTKEAVEREVDDARRRLSSAGRDLKAEAEGAGASISSSVSDAAERSKDEAAEGLRAFSGAIRRASDELGARDASIPARLAQEAAHGLERLSDGLQARSVADMSRSIGDFGRQNPAAFLTGCLLAGVAIGRVLVASGDRARGYGDEPGRGDTSGFGDGYGRTGASDYRPDTPAAGLYADRASGGSVDFAADREAAPTAPATPTLSDPLLGSEPPKPAGVDDDPLTTRPGVTTGGSHGQL